MITLHNNQPDDDNDEDEGDTRTRMTGDLTTMTDSATTAGPTTMNTRTPQDSSTTTTTTMMDLTTTMDPKSLKDRRTKDPTTTTDPTWMLDPEMADMTTMLDTTMTDPVMMLQFRRGLQLPLFWILPMRNRSPLRPSRRPMQRKEARLPWKMKLTTLLGHWGLRTRQPGALLKRERCK